jgi:integrase
VRISLKTKDPLEAQQRALVHNAALEKYWNNLVHQKGVHVDGDKWRDSVSIVRAYGFSYKSVEEIEKESPPEEVIERLAVVEQKKADKQVVQAITGLSGKSGILIGAAADLYFKLTQDRVIGKSDDFIRKWKNPRLRAVNNFIKAIADKPFDEISRADINSFRVWWMNKITRENMNPGTATKDMIHLKDIIRVLASQQEIDIDVDSLFSSAKFKNKQSSRVPFEASFVQNQILNPENLAGLNEEAKALVYIMADTGARVSEVIGLLPEDIFLDKEIPFIWIRPNKKRTLKNRPSERQVPLVGAALKGIQMIPHGFLRYDLADSVSNLVNQYFDNNGLKPSLLHTLYSLRHTFKDRLRDIGAPEEVTDELMGHSGHRPRYGRGHTLETKYEWLKKIAFKNLS